MPERSDTGAAVGAPAAVASFNNTHYSLPVSPAIAYSLQTVAGKSNAGNFVIEAATGQIKIGASPPSLQIDDGPYEVRVTATQGAVDASVTVVISVSNVADPPSPPQNVQVVGGALKTATATWQKPTSGGDNAAGIDYDVDTLTYSLEWRVAGSSDALQTATGVTGLTHTVTGLKGGSTYSFTVYAHNANSGQPASRSEGVLATATTLVNNPPSFSSVPTGEFKLPEGVTSLNGDREGPGFPFEVGTEPPRYTLLATDIDTGDQLTFRILSTTPPTLGTGNFRLSAQRSVGDAIGVTLEYLDSFDINNGGEDYEAVPNGPLYKILVEVSDGEAQAVAEVKVRVTDVDEAPVVELSDVTAEAPRTGTRTRTLAPDEAYDPEGKAVTYQWAQVTDSSGSTVISGSNSLIDGAVKTTRTVDVALPALAANAPDVLYYFRLTATDPRSNSAASVAAIRLISPTIPDNPPPTFGAAAVSFSLAEVPYNLSGAAVPGVLGTIPYTDTRAQFASGPRDIAVSIQNPSAEVAQRFKVENTGSFFQNTQAVELSYTGIGEDYEEDTKSYTIEVRVQDEGGGSATKTVTVNLANLQDYPDTPSLPTVTARGTDTISVSWSKPATRNRKNGTGDYYQYNDFELRYRPTGASASWETQAVDAGVTAATLTGLMSNTPYEVQVRGTATDQGNDLLGGLSTANWPTAQRWSPSALAVTLAAAPPVFAAGAVTRTIAENTSASSGTPVALGAAVTATNPEGVSGTITYSLAFDDANDRTLFSIDATTGAISSIAPLDFEAKSQHSFDVIAERIDNSSASKLVQINVTDVSEPTAFLLNGSPTNSLNRTVRENSVAPTAVGAPIVATDDDTKDGIGALTYTLANDDACKDRNNAIANCADYFEINGATGQITVKSGFTVDDYDLGNNRAKYAVKVTATDASANPAPREPVTITVFINITNVTEPPVFIDGLPMTVEVPENTPGGTQIGTFTARNPDGGGNPVYNLRDSDDEAALFAMHPHTGVLTLKSSSTLDYDKKSEYNLGLRAIRVGVASTTFELTVLVTPVNAPPEFSSDPASADFANIPLNENVTAETVLLTIVVTDPDGDPNLEFESLKGAVDEGFSLRPLQDAALKDEGTIKADLLYSNATPRDFETATDKSFILSLTAKDSSGSDNNKASLIMTVNLVDINDAPKAVGTIPAQRAQTGQAFTLATAGYFSDEDSIDTSAYSLTLDDGVTAPPSWLSINASTGVVSATSAGEGVFALRVTYTDSGNLTATQDVTLAVSLLSFGSSSIDDQSLVAQLATTPVQLPPAQGGVSPLSYSLVAVNASGSTGTLVNNLPQGLSFDGTPTSRQLQGTPAVAAVGVYDMTYTVADSFSPPAEAELTFQLTIAANQPPVFDAAARATVKAGYDYIADTANTDLVLPAATGGEAGLSYSLTAVSDSSTSTNLTDGLPNGLTYTPSTRTLSGTPTAVDTYTLTYTATDGDSNQVPCTSAGTPANCDTASITFALRVVVEAKPSLAAVSSRTYQTGAAVDLTLPESPTGNGDLTYSLTGLTGSELTFDASTRKLTGTVSTVAVYNLIYTVVDSDSNEVACTGATPPANCDTASVAFTLTVVTDIAPTLAAVPAQSYLVGATVDLQLPESPTGNGTLTYNLTGHRGAGLTFDASTRTLSGAPTVAGVYSLTYRVTDGDSNTLACTASDTPSGCDTASVVFTLTIEEDARPTLASTDAVAQAGVNGQPLATITLPLAADGNFGLTGVLTGTLDGASVSVAEATGVISLSGVDSGLVFTQQADSRTAATITGRPTADGTYALIYTVVDGDSNEVACTGATPPANCDTALVSVTLTVVADSVPVLAAVPNIIYPTGSTVDQTLPPATGGNGDLTYSLTGLTGSGLVFDPATRKITGTASAAAPYSLTYTAMDGDTNSVVCTAANTPAGCDTAGVTFTLTVAASAVLALADVADMLYLTGATVAQTLPPATGSNGTPTYSLTGTYDDPSNSAVAAAISVSAGKILLPDGSTESGLTFNAGTRELGGSADVAGIYSLTLTAAESDANTPICAGAAPPATCDTVGVTFTLTVEADTVPTLTPSTVASQVGNTNRALTITLPLAAGGNGDLQDGLSGTHTPSASVSNGTAVKVDAATGVISLSDDSDSGLVFTPRTADAKATITGLPKTTGEFELTYEVLDFDVDPASATFTLTVSAPTLTLAGGVADGAGIELKKDGILSTDISLPRVSGGTSPTYALTAKQTLSSAGAPVTEAATAVATTAAAAPGGLTYTADTGSSAGKLSGTPTAVGTWELIYTLMDGSATDSTSFTVSVVEDSNPALEPVRLAALNGQSSPYSTGEDVALGAPAFLLPAIADSGHGAVTESLTTTCEVLTVDCSANLTTQPDGNIVPTGLTFSASSGGTPASLTGAVTAVGDYQITYTLTDTAIGSGNAITYQAAETADSVEVVHTLDVVLPADGVAQKTNDIAAITNLPRSTSSVASTRAINLYDYFRPPAGLTFTAMSSNTKVLTLTETGGVLTLTATQAGGTSTVSVSASNAATSTDPSTSFEVTVVPNNAPELTTAQQAEIQKLSQSMTLGADVALDLDTYFSDADADAGYPETLTYELLDTNGAVRASVDYEQSSTTVLTAALSGTTLTLSPKVNTTADVTITVRATDPGGNPGTGTFVATVSNTAPTAIGSIAPITLAHGQSHSISDVAALFSDTDSGDSLTYTFSAADTAALTGVLTGTSLTLTAAADIAATSTTATLTASDGKATVDQPITVTISNAAPALSGTAQAPLALLVGGASASIDLSTLFSDTDSTLSYTATSSAATVASLNTDANDVPVSGGTPTSSLEITAEAVGSATLTLSANDRATRSGVSNPSLTVAVTVTRVDRPMLADTAVADQTYTLGQTPAALTLPLAIANTGNGTLTYTLSGSFTPTGGGGGAITVDDEGDIVQGATDTGLDFTDVSGATAASIGGVPTAAGALALTWTLSDGDQNEVVCTGLSPLAPAGCDTDFDSFAITLNAAPTFGAATVADVSAAVNTAISDLDLPRATAGTAPLAYRLTGVVVSGAALGSTTLGSVAHQHPAGLTFALSSSGATEAATLVGTPAAAGVYSMTWTATDANSIGTSAAFQIIVSGSTPLFVGTVADQSLSAQLAIAAQTLPAAAGGTGALTYSLTGAIASGSTGLLASNLPAGLVFDADTRVLSGTPTSAGAYDMTYSATDTATSAQRGHPDLPADSRGERSAGVQRRRQSSGGGQLQLPDGHRHQRLGAARSRGWRRGAVVQPDGDGGHRCEYLQQPAGWPVLQQRQQDPVRHADGGGQLQPDLCGGRHGQQHSLQRHGDHCVHGCGGGGHGSDADAVDSHHRQRQQGPRADGHRPAAGGRR